MSEIRKVLGDLIAVANELHVVHGPEASGLIGLAALIGRAESLLQSLPADGAWYPTWDQVSEKLGCRGQLAVTIGGMQILRATADVIRERGGQVGGSDDCEALADMLADARNELDMIRAALGLEYEPHQSLHERTLERARELTKAQPTAPARVVAWFTDDYLTDKSATTYDKTVADRWAAKGWPVTALYSHSPHPSGVPAEVMAAAEFLAQWFPGDGQYREHAELIRDWLKSLPTA